MIALLIFLLAWLGIIFKNNIPLYSLLVIAVLFTLHRLTKSKRIIAISISIFALFMTFPLIREMGYKINQNSFKGFVYDSRDNYFLFHSGLKKYYVKNYDNKYEVGDYLKIDGKLNKIDFPTLESDFDFNDYLSKKGVKYEISVDSISVKFLNPIKIQAYRRWVLSIYNDDPRSLIDSIYFGRYEKGDNLSNLFSELHLYRLAGSCGLYFLFIAKFIENILFRKKHIKRAKMCSIIFLTFISALSIPRFSAIRVTSLLLIKWLNDYVFKKKYNSLSLVSFLGIIFLIIDPYLAYQDTFILGFACSIFMRLLSEYNASKTGYSKKLSNLFLLYIFLVPFEISFNHSLSILSWLFSIPLSFFLIPIISLGIPFISNPLFSQISNHSMKFVGILVKGLKWVNIEIYVAPLNPWITLLYYAILFLFIYYSSIGFKPLKKITVVALTSFYLINFIPFGNFIYQEVSFINVGQGDSCFIRNKNTAILIDTGGLTNKDVAKDCLIPFFKKRRIYDIDLLITTHDDYDHSGGVDSLKKNFRIKRYYKDNIYFPIKIGGITLTNYNTYFSSNSDENAKSLVIGFNLMNKSFLITGDADKEIESHILENNKDFHFDILKVGHHGSNTSSSEAFIKTISPIEAVISCGKNNKYGHPHKEVINILNKYDIKIRRTDLEGTITYKSFKFI